MSKFWILLWVIALGREELPKRIGVLLLPVSLAKSSKFL